MSTWCKLLQSLNLRVLAEDRLPSAAPGAAPPIDPTGARALEACRRARGWSRRELARRAAVSIDTIASLEHGGGLLGKLDQVCAALGLRLVFRLPPGHATLESLWSERAALCLEAPAQFPPPRRSRGGDAPLRGPAQISASKASAAASARNSARLTASAPTGSDAHAAAWTCASPDSMLKAASRNAT